jgi:hypothetical protein
LTGTTRLGELQCGEASAHGAGLGAGVGEVGEVTGGGRWGCGYRLQAFAGAPGGERAPVRAVAAHRVGGAGGFDVAGFVLGEGDVLEQRHGIDVDLAGVSVDVAGR